MGPATFGVACPVFGQETTPEYENAVPDVCKCPCPGLFSLFIRPRRYGQVMDWNYEYTSLLIPPARGYSFSGSCCYRRFGHDFIDIANQ
jgi:hypothetical protein